MNTSIEKIKAFSLKRKLLETEFHSEILFDNFKKSLNGLVSPEIIVLPSDPGKGKSRGLQKFLRKFLDGEISVSDSGIIIFLSRKEEILNYISGAKLSPKAYSVLDAQPLLERAAYYGGERHADNAPILFMTTQLLHSRCGHSFEAFPDTFYKGKPRRLRIWDEGFNPANVITASVDDLAKVRVHVRRDHPVLAGALDAAEHKMKAATKPGIVTLPILPSVSAAERSGHLTMKERRLLETLSGKSGRVSVSMGITSIAVEASRLPDDLAPLFVLDASARVSATYSIMKDAGVNISVLPVPAPSYANAQFHWMKVGAGRASLKKYEACRERMLAEVVAVLEKDPAEPTLVIYNNVEGYDIPALISNGSPNPKALSFVKWGDHRASNAHRMIKRVICVGLMRYPDVGYDKLHMESLGDFTNRAIDIPMLTKSEACSLMLQDFTRSNLRNHYSGVCGKCDIYVMDSERNMEAMLSSTFPDCKITPWERVTTKLTRTQKLIIDYLVKLDKVELAAGIKRSAVYKALKIEKSQFAKAVKDKQFVVEAARISLIIGKTRVVYEEERSFKSEIIT